MGIKNFGTGTPKFNEGIIVSGSDPQLYVSGNINIDSLVEPKIQFQIGGADRSKIYVNTSNNLVLQNDFSNKHVVFKASDAGSIKEGLRLDGAIPEVVVNQGSEALVDFRVESDNNTHMLFVDGSEDKVGIGTASPSTTLHAYANVSNAYVATIDNDQASAGHVLKLLTDGNGSGSRLLEMEDGDGDVIFRARADGRFGFGQDGVDSMGAGTFVVGIDNSSHTADIAISKRLQHMGDSNTYMDFPAADQIEFVAGGVDMLKMVENGGSSEVTFNDGASADLDFVIKGDSNNPLFKCDATNNRVGIGGIGSPSQTLEVGGDIGINGKLVHNGDLDTYLDFPSANTLNLVAGGHSVFKKDGNDILINNSNQNYDTKIMADDGNVVLHVDAGTNKVGIGTTTPGSGLHVADSISLPVGSLRTGAYSIAEDDFCIVADCNASAFTLTLPSATDAMAGRIYTIKRMDSGNSGGGNQLTISRNGKNIDNIAGDLILSNLEAIVLQCIGASGGWIRTGGFLPPIP